MRGLIPLFQEMYSQVQYIVGSSSISSFPNENAQRTQVRLGQLTSLRQPIHSIYNSTFTSRSHVSKIRSLWIYIDLEFGEEDAVCAQLLNWGVE